jgi:predicted nuclease of predicted toxin-antitoxin system
MRLLLDACISQSAAAALAKAGHDVCWAPEPDPGDHRILALALSERRVVVTADKDFGELAVARQQPHVGIVRLTDPRLSLQARLLCEVLERHAEVLAAGALVTVEPGRVRIRTG